MKYTIISRDEFLKLIKLGIIYQSINYIADEKNQQKVLTEILKALSYDDPFGYVVIEFTYEESSSIPYMQTLVKLDIKDIMNIYCLTNEALDFYKTKFNPNIKFKLFENQELVKEVDSYKLIEDKKKGIEVLFDIFELNLKSVNEKFNDNLIKELLEFKENNYLNQEYKDFYFDLFCYERKNSFFKEDVGIIADIRAISKMQDIRRDKEVFLSGNYLNLFNEKDRENLEFTLKTLIIDSIKKVKKSDKKTDEEKNEIIRNLVVAAIFLKSQKLLNTESREQNYWESFINVVNEFKKEFLEETKEALWYLGVFLGYKYLYYDYYNFLDLNIFKENELRDVLINEKEEDSERSIQNNNLNSENIQDKNSSNQSNLINQIKEENELLKKQLEEKVQSEKGLKEEIERKNQELLKQTQQLKDSNQNSCNLDNEITSEDNTVTEKEVYVQKNDSNKFIESIEKQDEQFNHKENYQEQPEAQNQQKKLDNEDMNKESFQFTDEEITKFTITHLKEIAKERGVDLTAFTKKFPNKPEGKIALYNAIKASAKLDI